MRSGLKRRVSTGAMFSMTLCFTSTRQEATSTAPIAPHGSSRCVMNTSALRPMASNTAAVKPARRNACPCGRNG